MIKEEIEYLTHRFDTELQELVNVKSKILELLNDEKIEDEYVDKITTRIRNATETFTKAIDYTE